MPYSRNMKPKLVTTMLNLNGVPQITLSRRAWTMGRLLAVPDAALRGILSDHGCVFGRLDGTFGTRFVTIYVVRPSEDLSSLFRKQLPQLQDDTSE